MCRQFDSVLRHHIDIRMRLWWKGRHAILRGWWAYARMGSSPINRTIENKER